MIPNDRHGGARGDRHGGALSGRAVASLAGARPQPFWTSQPGAPAPAPALTGHLTAGLAVVGGGFSGLWTALLARERDRSADVILIEAGTTGWAASGRNGGFCSASLTHGIGDGLARFPGEMPLLEKLGAENLAEIGETIAARGIDCGFAPVGELTIATQPWQLDDLHEEIEAARGLGHDAWGGAIDTCSRFFAFYGTARRGRLAYACGHTGLGVGASRFAANVMLDLLSGHRTERTELGLVRSRPVPFPPEPARSAVVQLTRASLARADRDAGRRNLWLRTLDRLGLGFDS